MSVTDLIFQTGFDILGNLSDYFYVVDGDYPPSLVSPGRFGYGQCAFLAQAGEGGSHVGYVWPTGPYTRLVAGFAIKTTSNSFYTNNSPIYTFLDSMGKIVGAVTLSALGVIGYYVGNFDSSPSSPTFASAPLAFTFEQWVYVEVDLIANASGAGAVQIMVNGQVVLHETGVTTSSTPNIYGSAFVNGGSNYVNFNEYFDDAYTRAPSSMTLGDSFLGDVKAVPIAPNAIGHEDDFIQTGGTSGEPWTAVNDIPPDGDTSTVSSNTPGNKELFKGPQPSTLTDVTEIYGVSGYALVRKDDSPARVVSFGISDGTTDHFDAGAAVGSDYKYIVRQFPVNPITGVAWVDSDFAVAQFGIELVS
jgi:hypothetical protein